MFPHRRHRKSSPDPIQAATVPGSPIGGARGGSGRGAGEQSTGSDGDGSNSSSGFYSYFATAARRRWGKVVKSDNDTLLPTTFSSPNKSSSMTMKQRGAGSGMVGGLSSSASSALAFNPTTKSCNNFLMGGHYYPGKDKKRRTMRRKTLWYRIFCASTWRKGISFLFATYIVVYHGFVPLGNWLLEIGQSLSSSVGSSVGVGRVTTKTTNNWLQYDSTLMIPTLKEEQSYREKIISERKQLQFLGGLSSSKQQTILEGIVPNWFHRNDPPAAAAAVKTTTNRHGDDEKKKNNKRVDQRQQPKDNNNNNNNQDGAAGGNGNGHQHKKRKNVDNNNNNNNNNNKTQTRDGGEIPLPTNTTTTKQQQVKNNKDNNDKKKMAASSLPKIRFNNNNDNNNSTIYQRRLLQVKGDEFTIVRNLHNMDDLASSQSSCPSSSSSSPQQQQQQQQHNQKWETTLVIQTSLNRLWILNETCQRWKDPIIAVVFIRKQQQNEDEDEDPGVTAATEAALMITQIISSCPDVNIIQYEATKEESTEPKNYPVNKLRNIGLDAVTTSHVLVIDIDFIPSQNLHITIHDALRKRYNNNYNQTLLSNKNGVGVGEYYDTDINKQALIVPAFERKPPKPCESADDCNKYLQSNSSFIPQTFEDLQNCYINKSCIVFQSEVNWEGHYSTRSEEWLLQKKWYEKNNDDENNNDNNVFRTLPCFHTARYEPYVVLRWCPDTVPSSILLSEEGGDASKAKGAAAAVESNNNNNNQKPVAPYYDERFHGYGKNKIELVSQLRKSGYRFAILPEGFIVHNPHKESQIKETWNDRSNSDLHASMDQLYTIFLNELDKKYRDIHNITIKLCRHQ